MALVSCPKCEYEFDARVPACPSCGEAVTSFVRQHAGRLVDGKYRVLERLGRGGMGEVFKAEHVHLGTTRVIKVMRPQIAGEKELQDRFTREAKLATRIQHPNVATLHDFSILPDNSCYMVWEYIEGTDLSAFAKSSESLDAKVAIQLIIQALRGLEAIHEAGIVHRDISPENLMVSAGSSTGLTVKVIDLGIAKSDSTDGSLTSTGVFIGKWNYASPEHLGLLESGEKIDGRADLFSMGIVLYELLAGSLPFQAETPGQYILLHAGDKPSPVTPDRISVPDAPGLEMVLEKALQRERAKRYSTAGEFISDLEKVLAGTSDSGDATPTMVLTPKPPSELESETAPGPTAPETVITSSGVQAQTSTNRALMTAAVIAGVLAVVIAVALVVIVTRMRQETDVTPRAGLTVTSAEPAGEMVEIPAEVTETTSTTAQPEIPSTDTAVEAPPAPDPAEPVRPAPPQPATQPVVKPENETPVPEKPVVEKPTPPAPAKEPIAIAPPPGDTIPTSGEPMFGWRSKRLIDDPSYKAGFTRGIIRDYSDMWSRGGVDWASVARGIHLSDHAIRVNKFRNMTSFTDEAMMHYLDNVLQEELDNVAGSEGTLTADAAIYWAQTSPRYGVGIEMIFRDSTGRVVAKIRHVHYEDSLEDAAQEMIEYVTDFVEDHETIE